MSQIIFITGVSTGLGRALAEAALAAGHIVVGTLRKEAERAEFTALQPGRSFGIALDMTDTAAIAPAIARVEAEIGPIDALVNNAGYGHEGVLEEATLDELRHQFEVNVFAPIALMQAVLPFMRQRRAGRIINITSMAGYVAGPGLSFYHGSKFALEGMSESLAKEVKPFGIFVTALAPGSFRTDWSGRSMVRTGRKITDYDASFDPTRTARAGRNGKQPGDPAKAAKVILTILADPAPPARLLMGSDALNRIREKLGTVSKEIEAWKELTVSTDFAD